MKVKLIIWGGILILVFLFILLFVFLGDSVKNKPIQNEQNTNNAVQKEKIDIDSNIYEIITTFYNDNLSPKEKSIKFESICTKQGLQKINAYLGYSDDGHLDEYKKPSEEVKYEIEIKNINTYTRQEKGNIQTVTFFDINTYINNVKNTASYQWKCEFISIDEKLYLDNIIIS